MCVVGVGVGVDSTRKASCAQGRWLAPVQAVSSPVLLQSYRAAARQTAGERCLAQAVARPALFTRHAAGPNQPGLTKLRCRIA